MDTISPIELTPAEREGLVSDILWFDANPSSKTRLRYVLPNEAPEAKRGEIWLVAVHLEPGGYHRHYFKWPTNSLPTEQIFSCEEIASGFFNTADADLSDRVLARCLFHDILKFITVGSA
jgi:hypothetical protein